MRAFLFFITFAVFVAMVVWRVDQLMFGDKLAWSEAQSRAQMSAIVHALDTEVQSYKDVLTLGFPEIEQAKKDFPSGKAYSRFQMVARLLPPNIKDDKKDWQIISSFYQAGSPTKNWASSYINLLLKNVKASEVKNGSANLYALLDPQRKPFLLLLSRHGGNYQAGLLGPEALQSLMDRQKGQLSTIYIVNLQGQALGHTIPEYVGSLLTEDPIVSEVMKSSVGSGFGKFNNLKGEPVQGLYEQVEDSNLYAVITTPLNALMKNRNSERVSLAVMGMGLALIGLASFVFMDRNSGTQTHLPPRPVLPTPMAAPPMASTRIGMDTNFGMSEADKMKAYTKVASSLSHELKSPLTSILANVQLAQTKGGDPERNQEHLQKIESEARAAREIIQKLLIFAGEDKFATQKAGLETVVNRALKQTEGRLFSKGIKVQKNIQSVSQFTMSSDLLVRAVEALLNNAIEAMERAPKKELSVQLSEKDGEIHFNLTDSGEGIASQDLNKIFDPFFTTRSGSQHVGLGLSTALGIFKEAFGQVEVQSEKGKGTTMKVTFRPDSDAVPASKPSKPEVAPFSKAPAGPMPNPPAPPAVAAAPTLAKQEPIGMDTLLIDNSIEKMIDDVEEDDDILTSRKADFMDLPPPPQAHEESIPRSPPPPSTDTSTGGFSAKIDKPKIDLKKKPTASRVDEMQVSVRRPGSRS
jgi:two-component system NtrC family sensor kinase